MSLVRYLRRDRPRLHRQGLAEDAALAAIVRSSQDAVIAKTIDGVITAWNDGATHLYGHTAEYMLGRHVEEMVPADSLGDERVRRARVAAGIAESGYRCRRLRVDGQVIDVVMSMSAIRDSKGRVIGLASLSRPVSEREEVEASLASLLDAAPDGMLCVDTAGMITMASSQACEMLGYRRTELLGAPVELLLPGAVRDVHRRHRADFARSPRARQMGTGLSLSARRRDGSTFAVEVSLAVDGVGDRMVTIVAVRDVTAQRDVEAAVRVSETQLRQLAEHVAIVFALIQLTPFAFLYVSPSFERLTGWTPEDLVRSPNLMLSLVHPDDRAEVQQRSNAGRAGQPIFSEHRIIRADGQIRWVRTFSSPVPNPQGPPERSVISLEDVTERVQVTLALRDAEAVARAANEAKNAFLSRMSHELRTPLNAVLGFGQLLERRLEDTENLSSVRHIIKAGRQLLDLINEVLDIARIDAGEVSVSMEPIHVGSLIEETAELVQPMASGRDVAVHITAGPAALHVMADRQRLRQVLLNFLSNAIKYNHEHGSVWITWELVDGQGAISVRDDGRGIAPELHSRLFTPFDRLGAETTSVEGTGVGLAVTRALVELMHGFVSFRSLPGVGTTFTVTLPATSQTQTVVDDMADLTIGDAAPQVPATLLYIEDNAPNVLVVESLVRLRPGWRLLHAGMGSLGIELTRAHHPDLVLLDLHLPDISGFDALLTLKSDPGTAEIPIVILSADASIRQRDRLLDAGAFQYLTKPLDVSEVLALLDDIAANLAVPGPAAHV